MYQFYKIEYKKGIKITSIIKLKMYKSNKVLPYPVIKNFDPNNPIHARMMENVRVIEYGRQNGKIMPVNLQYKSNTKKKYQHHSQEEGGQLVN